MSIELILETLTSSLGDTNRQFTLWHDGGEWLISIRGKEQEQCKALKEWFVESFTKFDL